MVNEITELPASQILEHFYIDIDGPKNQTPKDLESLLMREDLKSVIDVNQVMRYVHRLMAEGLLIESSPSAGNHPFLGRRFISFNFDSKKATNGEYECLVKGWPEIYRRFKSSVLLVEVDAGGPTSNVGTAFVVGNKATIFTALHNVRKPNKFRLVTSGGETVAVRSAYIPKDEKLDLAVMLASQEISSVETILRVADHEVAEAVLCLGYPAIPGFNNVMTAEAVDIASDLITKKGTIAASESAYLDDQPYILVNNRIGAGSSGGPAINKKGQVVGVVVAETVFSSSTSREISVHPSGDGNYFGQIAPKRTMLRLLRDDKGDPVDAIESEIRMLEDGWLQIC